MYSNSYDYFVMISFMVLEIVVFQRVSTEL